MRDVSPESRARLTVNRSSGVTPSTGNSTTLHIQRHTQSDWLTPVLSHIDCLHRISLAVRHFSLAEISLINRSMCKQNCQSNKMRQLTMYPRCPEALTSSRICSLSFIRSSSNPSIYTTIIWQCTYRLSVKSDNRTSPTWCRILISGNWGGWEGWVLDNHWICHLPMHQNSAIFKLIRHFTTALHHKNFKRHYLQQFKSYSVDRPTESPQRATVENNTCSLCYQCAGSMSQHAANRHLQCFKHWRTSLWRSWLSARSWLTWSAFLCRRSSMLMGSRGSRPSLSRSSSTSS